MRKSDYALEQVTRRLSGGDPVQLDTLIAQAWQLTDDGDPRWIMVALMRLHQAGNIVYPICDHNHNHGADCTVRASLPS